MKKLFKKTLIILIVFIIVFEFCISSTSYAAELNLETTINLIGNLGGGVVSVIHWIPRIVLTGAAVIFNKLFEGVATANRRRCCF